MAVFQGTVGIKSPFKSLPDGSPYDFRLGNMQDLIVQELHGRYYEETYRKNVYSGFVTGVTTTLGTAVTYTGLCLSNPVGSTVNLVLLKVGYGFTIVWPAVAAVGLMCGYNAAANVTQSVAITPQNCFVGPAISGQGKLTSGSASSGLGATPIVTHIFGAGMTGAATVAPFDGALIDMEGSVILTAGAYCAIYTSAVSPTSGAHFSFTWAEVPV